MVQGGLVFPVLTWSRSALVFLHLISTPVVYHRIHTLTHPTLWSSSTSITSHSIQFSNTVSTLAVVGSFVCVSGLSIWCDVAGSLDRLLGPTLASVPGGVHLRVTFCREPYL
jgi:hypothetical protein